MDGPDAADKVAGPCANLFVLGSALFQILPAAVANICIRLTQRRNMNSEHAKGDRDHIVGKVKPQAA